MLDIYFQTDKEVIQFCERFFSYHKQIDLKWNTDNEWGNHLQFDCEKINADTIKAMSMALADLFLDFQLASEVRKVIVENYYYQDNDEIEQILETTFFMFQEKKDQVHFKNGTRPIAFLSSLFEENMINTGVIHYPSIVKFRLNQFKEQLKDYVGLAIDEFKQEEDHQEFIEMLRNYIAKTESTYREIHVLQGDDFSFFGSNGKQLSGLELRNMMYQEPLYIVGLDRNELNLAPLIAIAPQKVFIYGDNPSEPKTLTVINVFQERVTFNPYSHFPFHHSLEGKSK